MRLTERELDEIEAWRSAAEKASKMIRLSSFDAPKPQSSPKVIVPRQISDTRSPLFTKSLYLSSFSGFCSFGGAQSSPRLARIKD